MAQTQELSRILSSIFAPGSLAAIPEGEKGYDSKIASKVAPNLSLIKAGDLILTRTSSTLYNVLRIFTSEPYDHIAVVLSDKLVLHIGPGLIRTLSLVRLLEPQRSPIVLRPILTQKERDKFLTECWSMIGEKYDLVRVFDFILRLIVLNWTKIKIPFKKLRVDDTQTFALNNINIPKKKKLWVCSDAVMNKLIKSNKKYNEFLMEDRMSNKSQKDVMFNNLGSLTIKDFITIANKSHDLFQIIKLPLTTNNESNGSLRKYLNIFNELSLAQKLLLIILIIYIINAIFGSNDRKNNQTQQIKLKSKL